MGNRVIMYVTVNEKNFAFETCVNRVSNADLSRVGHNNKQNHSLCHTMKKFTVNQWSISTMTCKRV